MSLFEDVNKNLKESELKTFKVCIEETVSEEFEIEAEDEDDAWEKAKQGWRTGEIVLEPGELVSASCAVADPETGDYSEFVDIY